MILGLGLNAQSVYHSSLRPIQKEGFRKVKILPEIRGCLKNDYSDLRISNEEGEHSAYILKKGNEIIRTKKFESFEIEKFLHQKRTRYEWGYYSEVIVKNTREIELDELYMEINNARVRKNIRLSGSENGKDWYVISNNCRYNISESSTTTQMIQLLDFPIVNYPYIKIIIRDYAIDPLKINKVGYFIEEILNFPKDTCVFKSIQKEGGEYKKTTKYKVRLKQGYYLDYLKLDLSGEQFYNRKVKVLVSDTVKHKKTEKIVDRIIATHWVNSKQQNILNLPNEKLQEFTIKIENQDNAELELKKIQGLCIPSYIVTELKVGENYKLEMGDDKLKLPNYDLIHFENELTILPNEVKTELPFQMHQPKMVKKEKEIPAWITWGIIGFVMILLMFFSIKMIKEMKEG